MRKLIQLAFMAAMFVLAAIACTAAETAEAVETATSQTMTCEGTFGVFFAQMESENYRIEESSFQTFYTPPVLETVETMPAPTAQVPILQVLGPKVVPLCWYWCYYYTGSCEGIPLTEEEMRAIHAP
jgi:hypothetical protein